MRYRRSGCSLVKAKQQEITHFEARPTHVYGSLDWRGGTPSCSERCAFGQIGLVNLSPSVDSYAGTVNSNRGAY